MASPAPLNNPAPHGAWTFYPFLIAMNHGAPARVDFGKARGAFGVHGEDDGWHLTHLPTGALIGIAPSAEAAMHAAEGIERVWDWTSADEPDDSAAPVIREVLRINGVKRSESRPVRVAPVQTPVMAA
ncbi:hypothetical protein [Azospirillum argentinense]|uniref:Uncharacterized protein n=1 Tax=Azospirillum brasilense TaxID=192 RepID=A0A4D8QC51_AZOBR|nr:hypothetical protein [Azospirillum argentinense]QCO07334.1 hypothetical protein D3867_36245 [Azospirillum argentinense]